MDFFDGTSFTRHMQQTHAADKYASAVKAPSDVNTCTPQPDELQFGILNPQS